MRHPINERFNGLPIICIASGRPFLLNPVGTDNAGLPVILNGARDCRP